MTIIHLYPNFNNIGGAQSMIITLYLGMKSRSKKVKVAGFTPYSKIHKRYQNHISEQDYIEFCISNRKEFNKSIVLVSHHRKITTLLSFISKIFFLKLKIIHVAHNEFYNLKRFSLFPKSVISVSERVKYNLEDFFKINQKYIKVIYNGISDNSKDFFNEKQINLPIKLVYPARINKIKKQLDFVHFIKKERIKDIQVIFCGDGEKLNELQKITKGDNRFIVKGLVNNMEDEFKEAHFTFLFSEKEGLPVSLIESCKFGIPIICNDVGGNTEILQDKYNGYLVNTYTDFKNKIEAIKRLKQSEYSNLCIQSKNIFSQKFKSDKMIEAYLNYINQQYG